MNRGGKMMQNTTRLLQVDIKLRDTNLTKNISKVTFWKLSLVSNYHHKQDTTWPKKLRHVSAMSQTLSMISLQSMRL